MPNLSACDARELLKLETKTKLDRSGTICLAADHTERRGVLHAQCGVVEHHMVEGVQEVRREKYGNPFRHRRALGQGQVEIRIRKPAQDAAPRSTVFADLNRAEVRQDRLGVCKDIKTGTASSGIPVSTYAPRAWHARVDAVTKVGLIDRNCPRYNKSESVATTPCLIAFGDCQGEAARGFENAGKVPPADSLIKRLITGAEAGTAAEGEFINPVGCDDVAVVEKGWAVVD